MITHQLCQTCNVPIYRIAIRCNVTLVTQMVRTFTVTAVNQHVISFIHLVITLKWSSFSDFTEKSLRLLFYDDDIQWSHLMILMWPSFGDSIVNLLRALHCDKTSNNVTMKSLGDSQVTDIWRLMWSYHERCFVTKHQIISFCYHLGLVTTIMLTL